MIRPEKMKLSVMLTMAFLFVILMGVFVTGFAGVKLRTANEQQDLTGARLADLQLLQVLKDNINQQTMLLLNQLSNDSQRSSQEKEFFTLQKSSHEIISQFRTLINGARAIPGINIKEVDEASDLLKK